MPKCNRGRTYCIPFYSVREWYRDLAFCCHYLPTNAQFWSSSIFCCYQKDKGAKSGKHLKGDDVLVEVDRKVLSLFILEI
jgi:hypothetical protein